MYIYVTYLTVYRGSRMPMFYIGSTSLKRVEGGYGGTVCSREFKNIWAHERKNNPHLFSTRILSYHNSRPDALARERMLHLSLSVMHNPLYINRSIAGFHGTSFAGKSNPRYGKEVTSETRQKMREKKIGIVWSAEAIASRSRGLKGLKKDPDNKKFNYHQLHTCPHCQKIGKGPAMLGHIRKITCQTHHNNHPDQVFGE